VLEAKAELNENVKNENEKPNLQLAACHSYVGRG